MISLSHNDRHVVMVGLCHANANETPREHRYFQHPITENSARSSPSRNGRSKQSRSEETIGEIEDRQDLRSQNHRRQSHQLPSLQRHQPLAIFEVFKDNHRDILLTILSYNESVVSLPSDREISRR